MKGIIEAALGFFDRYFVHFFVCSMHLFFLALALWLKRGDLAALGVIMFIVSFSLFFGVSNYGSQELSEDEKTG